MSWIPAFQFARSGERASRMEVGLSDPQFPQVVPVPTPVFVCLIPDSFPAGGLNFYGIPRERAKSIKNSFIFLVSPFCHADSHDPFVRAPPSSTLSPDFAASDVHYYRQAPSRQFEDRAAIHAAAVLPKSGLGTKMPRPSMTTEAFWNLQENSPPVTLLRRA